MNNKEFITELAQRSGQTQERTQNLSRTLIDAIIANFEKGESVAIPTFGTFEVKKSLERIMVDPSTRKRIMVPPKLELNFSPMASIKEKLRKGGAE